MEGKFYFHLETMTYLYLFLTKKIETFLGILPSSGSQLVLAGDPKQLGPIIRSPLTIKFGLELSLLERLMNRDIYKPSNFQTI